MLLRTLRLSTSRVLGTLFAFTHLGVKGVFKQKAKDGVQVCLMLDRRQALCPHEAPLVAELLEVGVEIYVPVGSVLQFKKGNIVDDVIFITGSANATKKGRSRTSRITSRQVKVRASVLELRVLITASDVLHSWAIHSF
ncbi:unnamed protein product [Phytophthora lilii]|uniref:Unnamed protein product n=1 Tax=Phytophthora lilii TaxID=2077276 RepID=A0A9W7D7M7_9STRA|nr:unnamed protein product [Phytophthora lilii]